MALASDELVHVQAELAFTWGEDGVSEDVSHRDTAPVGTMEMGEDVVAGIELGDALVAADITPREQPLIESPLRELLHLTSAGSDDQDALRSTWSA